MSGTDQGAPLTAEMPNKIGAVARAWLMIAVSSLLLAGLLSLMLVIGRMPPFSTWMTDPEFFKRALVVHVDLALVVWFFAFGAALFTLGPGKAAHVIGKVAAGISLVGVLLMVIAAGVPGSEPILANYIPVIDHPVFIIGLILFAIGLIMVFVSGLAGYRRYLGHQLAELPVDPSAQLAFAAMAVVALLAALTFAISWLNTPLPSTGELAPRLYYELIFWGGGHVSQVASVLTMLGAWIILLKPVLGRSPVSPTVSAILFGGLALPQFAGPIIAAMGTDTISYLSSFTNMMQFGIFPFVLVFMGFVVRAFIVAHKEGRVSAKSYLEPQMIGFLSSAALTLLGFGLGALIRQSNTMIPAHYHAALGAVTVALMTVSFVLLEPLGLRVRGRKMKLMARFQPALFGIGQTVFAVGFAVGGIYGLSRKAYASEQQVRSTAELIGLTVMGIGGILAIIAGLIYLAVNVTAFWGAINERSETPRRMTWNLKSQRSTLYRS